MSSDPNQPVSEWWKQPQDPKRKQENQGEQGYQESQDPQESQATQQMPTNRRYQGYQEGAGSASSQGYQDSQATQQVPTSQGYPSGQGYQSGQGYPSGQGFPSGQAFSSGQGFPSGQGYQQDQDYRGNQGYQGTQGPPLNQGIPGSQGYQGPPPRVRRRRRKWPLITLIVIILVLVIGDRAANAYTEDQMASQMQASLALSGKPHVTIQGFPFLTQLAARDFNTVDISANNETAGPGGQLEIASLTATLHGMHIHGLKSATVDQFNASALITFAALGSAGGVPQGVSLSADGPNKIKASVDVGPLSESADAQITQTGPGQINIKVLDAGGITSDVLGNLNFNVTIPKLPAGVSIKSINVTQQGVRISVAGTNTNLSQ